MQKQIISIPGYRVYEYLLVMNPHEELRNKIMTIKKEFAEKHKSQKVIDILQKTLKKMSPRAIEAAGKIAVSERIKILLHQALAKSSAKS